MLVLVSRFALFHQLVAYGACENQVALKVIPLNISGFIMFLLLLTNALNSYAQD